MPVRPRRACTTTAPHSRVGRPSAFEQGLSEGLRTERRLFQMTFATADQKEGTRIFYNLVLGGR